MTDERRLAAIMFTDIVGYTALVEKDESLALRLLDKHNEAMRAVLERRKGGREVKTIGDAFLIEFESALEAVFCAIDLQAAMNQLNESADQRVAVRIGIHMGDVVHRNGDVLGDAVNIASRIVNFAEAGGICLSEPVYLQVRNKLQYPVEKMVGTALKNVDGEMDLYQVALPWDGGAPAARKVSANRIAILPFANVSPDPNDGYFADGLTDELISDLSEVQGLRVIARTYVNRYRSTNKGARQIGAELQVPYVLEGSVRKAGNKIRVVAQLIDTDSQEQVWSSRYDRDLDDVFTIQTDIARSVTDSLKVALLTGEKARMEKRETENVVAYIAYLKGRTLLQERAEDALKEAKVQFELAVREDSSYAKAYAGLADTSMLLGDYLFAPVPTSIERAKGYVMKALDLDPDLAEARASRAYILFNDFKFIDAEAEFEKAIRLNPSYATAHHWHASSLETFGRMQEALDEVLLAEQMDPLSSTITISVTYRFIARQMHDEVLKRIRKLRELDPQSELVDEAEMSFFFARRDWEKTMPILERMIERDPTDPYLDMDLGYIYAVTGRRGDAEKIIKKLEAVPDSARVKGFLIGFIYAGLGDLDSVFKWLEYAIDNKEIFFGWYRTYPLLESVRNDPRFEEMMARVGITTTSVSMSNK